MDTFLVSVALDFGNRPCPAMDANGRPRFSFGRFVHLCSPLKARSQETPMPAW